MKETAEQYIARITGYAGDGDPMKVIESTPAKLAELVKGLTAERLAYKPSPEKWSIQQQVAHLADSQFVLDSRIRWAAAQPGKNVVAFDQDQWAATGKYASIPVELSLATFTAARRWTVEFLRRLTAKEREGYIEHEERGKETIPHLLRMMAGHDLNHLRQIAELAKASEAGASRTRSA
jgi:hypothetical protein